MAAAICLATPQAFAQAQPSDIDRDAARTLVQQGDERMKEKNYEEALVAYRRADDIMGVPTTAIEVGKVELLLGHLVAADAAFRKAAAYPEQPDEPAPFTRAREEARRLADELAPRIPHLEVSVVGPASDIEVRIDGEIVEAWGSAFAVDPGPHEIEVRAEGYVDYDETFVLEEGDARQLSVTLEAKPPPPSTAPREAATDLWPMAIAGFSVAGAGLVVGAVTGGLSLSDASDAKAFCNDAGACSPEAADPLDRSQTLAHVSTTSFVLAGVGGAVGVVGLLLSLDQDEAASVAFGPGAITLRGRF